MDVIELQEKVQQEIMCRDQQVELMLKLFGQSEHYGVPSIFLYGHTGTGKTCIRQTILEKMQVPYVVVNCVECFTARLMYECILDGLTDTVPGPMNDYSHYAKCDNMNDFVKLLKQAANDSTWSEQTFYVIFEKAERLRDMEANLLPGILRLQELTGLNTTVILESEIVWEKFRCGTGVVEPYIIHFPDYSKDQLMEVMSLDCPEEISSNFYGNYINLLLSVFHLACRNLSELRYMAQMNWKHYMEPVDKGEATMGEMRKLWKNIEPHLKKALQTLYLREVSSVQWEKMQQEADNEPLTAATPSVTSRVNVELPFYSKYLLIAAYLASYNPAKSDRRFFSKNAGKMRRGQVAAYKKREKMSSQLIGPKSFPLDRLMAIFYAIVEGRVAPTANVFSQISSLVTLGLLSQATLGDQLDSPKYKCLVSLDFVKGISRSVNFEVLRYLHDLV